jgi:glutaredoxin
VKQQCHVAIIYLNWLLLAGGLFLLLFEHLYLLSLAWVVVLPFAMWAYIRVFPSISQVMGYGRIVDQPARILNPSPTKVRLYTALGCPFCPIVKQRLLALRERIGFELEEIDVTLKPGLLADKGIRAVPVVEAGERQLVGNATSEQLVQLVSSVAALPHAG